MSGAMSLAEETCWAFNSYRRQVEQSQADGIVTDEERARCERAARRAEYLAKRTDLSQRVGVRIQRRGHIDKNLMTEVRALEAEWEEIEGDERKAAAREGDPATAIFELAA